MKRILSVLFMMFMFASCVNGAPDLAKIYEGEYFTIQLPDDAKIMKTTTGYYQTLIEKPYNMKITAYPDRKIKLGDIDEIEETFDFEDWRFN